MTNVSGAFKDPSGALLAAMTLTLARSPRTAVAQGSAVVIPTGISVETDSAGIASSELSPGQYVVTDSLAHVRFLINVPDQATASWHDCLSAATVIPWPDAVQAAIDARDEAEAVVDGIKFKTVASRAAAVTWAAANTLTSGFVLQAGDVAWRFVSYAVNVISDMGGFIPHERITDIHFGAPEDYDQPSQNGTESSAALLAAIAYAGSTRGTISGGDVWILGRTLSAATIVLDKPGVHLRSIGAVGSYGLGGTADSTYPITYPEGPGIVFSNTSGPGILIKASGCGVQDVTIGATSARRAAPISTGAQNRNSGIVAEPDDTSSAALQRITIVRNLIRDQPADAVYACANLYGVVITDNAIINCWGHGIAVDDGALSGRVNLAQPGEFDIDRNRVQNIGGHILLLGRLSMPTITAGTDAQGQGAVTNPNTVIGTAAASPSGATLPAATVGKRIYLSNSGANLVNVYPASGESINGATNTSVPLGVGHQMRFDCTATGAWTAYTGDFTTATALTAGTNAQGQGVISATNTLITTAAAAPSGVTLPVATVGAQYYVANFGANTVNVYPASGGIINTQAANTSIALARGSQLRFTCTVAGSWVSVASPGAASSAGKWPYRIRGRGNEGFREGNNSAILLKSAGYFIAGDEVSFFANAPSGTSGYSGSTPILDYAVWVAGRCVHFEVCRYISWKTNPVCIGAVDGVATRDIQFIGGYASTQALPATYFAVPDAGVGTTYGVVLEGLSGNFSLPIDPAAMLAAGSGSWGYYYHGNAYQAWGLSFPDVIGPKNLKAGYRLSLGADAAASISFTGTYVTGILAIGPNLLAAGGALVAFRCGTFPYVKTLSSGGVTVGEYSVTLTGTTGTAGQLNVSATAAGLFIENRTGSARQYGVSPIAVDTQNGQLA